jgi:hypothetical protein
MDGRRHEDCQERRRARPVASPHPARQTSRYWSTFGTARSAEGDPQPHEGKVKRGQSTFLDSDLLYLSVNAIGRSIEFPGAVYHPMPEVIAVNEYSRRKRNANSESWLTQSRKVSFGHPLDRPVAA